MHTGNFSEHDTASSGSEADMSKWGTSPSRWPARTH